MQVTPEARRIIIKLDQAAVVLLVVVLLEDVIMMIGLKLQVVIDEARTQQHVIVADVSDVSVVQHRSPGVGNSIHPTTSLVSPETARRHISFQWQF